VELHAGCGAVATQLHGVAPCCVRSTKKATANAVAFFFWLLWSYVAAQLHEEGNSNCIVDFIFSLLLLMV
jgi:hypothetical protein